MRVLLEGFLHSLISSQCQTGVQDYEIFNEQLDSLGSWIVKAEEALEIQDPNGSTEPTVVQDRMEELKVFVFSSGCHEST